MSEPNAPVGGAFLSQQIEAQNVFIPENLSAEARLMARTMDDFMRKEIQPAIERLEAKEHGLMQARIQQAGQLGLLAGGLPERYGGLELSKTALTLLTEKSASYLSFAISISVHSGVATLPILYFGTPEQKEKYLPRMANGEIIGAFALSEANSGSDALAAQTRATLTEDGKFYRLTGEKMWITNGGFADVFIVFAKVEGERFTAFLVEKETPGLIIGREEHKMGLHGSSTCRLLLQNALVPAANVIGEVGKGHYSALYALNVGRFNIGVIALGAAKESLRIATLYAKQRVQFGQPIVNFGLIRQKLSGMATRIFALESMVYRVAGYYGDNASATNQDPIEHSRLLSEEYIIECAIIKFFGTEALGYVTDETLQIHGGFGYSEEFAAARMFRDARVFRIFEGTNEINRLTVLDQLLRREAKGRLALFDEHPAPTIDATLPASLREVGEWVGQIRTTILNTLTQGRKAFGEKLSAEQEIAAAIADMAAALFALESVWLRACQLHRQSVANLSSGNWRDMAEWAELVAQIYGATAYAQAEQPSRLARAYFVAGDAMPPFPTLDTISLSRQIAAIVVERNGYPG